MGNEINKLSSELNCNFNTVGNDIYDFLNPSLKIFVIECQNYKFFIDSSFNINQIYKKYFENPNMDIWCEWLQENKPLYVKSMLNIDNYFDEDSFVISQMAEFGINNVRGGSFISSKLSEADILTINKIISRCQKSTTCKQLVIETINVKPVVTQIIDMDNPIKSDENEIKIMDETIPKYPTYNFMKKMSEERLQQLSKHVADYKCREEKEINETESKYSKYGSKQKSSESICQLNKELAEETGDNIIINDYFINNKE